MADRPRKEIAGQQFGDWTVLKRAEYRGRIAMWVCRCACGNIREVAQANMLRGSSTRCDMHRHEPKTKQITHGKSASREYKIWQGIKRRCFNEKYKFYYLYGGRGISMIPRWAEDFQAFYEDIGPAPEGFTIERREVDGNYEPGNCEWISKGAQMENTTRTIRVESNGEVLSLKKFCAREGLIYHQARARLSKSITDRSIPVTSDHVRSVLPK